jgi:hypothetical protein
MATRMLSCKVALLGFTAILLVVGCWLLRLASDTREVA